MCVREMGVRESFFQKKGSGSYRQVTHEDRGKIVKETARYRSNSFDRTETARMGISISAPNDRGANLSML